MRTKMVPLLGGVAMAVGMVGASAPASVASQLPAASPSVFTMTTESSGPFPQSFNPFITSTYSGYVNHLIYEPLYMINYAKLQPEPWLATAYNWSNGGKTITFKIRPGVMWSNGTPFSASDVAFTFNLMMKNAAANTYALPLATSTAPTPTTAVINFTESSYSQLYNIMSTMIVSQKIWSTIPNPATYGDPNPVGTGPYTLETFEPQVITMLKNPHYWQPNLGKFNEVQAIQEDSSTSTEAATITGAIDFSAGGFLDHAALTKAHPYLVAEAFPFVDTGMVVNFTKYPLSLAPVRKAISEAINRSFLLKLLAPYSDTPMISQTGLVEQSMGRFIAPSLKNATLKYDPKAAKQALAQAGFKKGSNGILKARNGTPLQITLTIPSTYDNWVAIAPVLQSELKAVGIGLSIQLVAETTYAADAALGQFDLTNSSQAYTTPYGFYDFYLGSAGTAPIGKTATTDWGRYMNSATQTQLQQLNSAHPGTAASTAALNSLEATFVKETPFIPLFTNAQTGIFNTSKVTGFPTASNLYGFPSEINTELIVLHSKPAR